MLVMRNQATVRAFRVDDEAAIYLNSHWASYHFAMKTMII